MVNRYMKRCSTSLISRELQNKTAMRYYFTPVRMAIIKKTRNNKCWWGYREKRTVVHCLGDCKLVQLLSNTVWRFLKKLKTKLPYNPVILLLVIYPKKMKMVSKIYVYSHVYFLPVKYEWNRHGSLPGGSFKSQHLKYYLFFLPHWQWSS